VTLALALAAEDASSRGQQMSDTDIFALQTGATFQQRYRVVRCIKAGGMGAVYEVVDDRTDSPRALKVMLPSMLSDPDLRARFAQEAKITGNVQSDHIVRVSDAGIDAATQMPFLVMDLLKGHELGSLMESRGALPFPDVVTYLHQAALALDKTHAAGIVHRDLKPENLYLTLRDDGSPCVKILDFGIAKVVAQSTARMTRAMGTPMFMAPEQIRGSGAIGPRADLFALGHIAYALLSGEPYWKEETDAAESVYPLLGAIVTGLPQAPRSRALRRRAVVLPPAFDAWMEKATAVAVEQRFERATEMIVALADALGVASPSAATSSPNVGAGWSGPPSAIGAAPIGSGPIGAAPTGVPVVSTGIGARPRSGLPVALVVVAVGALAAGGLLFARSRWTSAPPPPTAATESEPVVRGATATATPVAPATSEPSAAQAATASADPSAAPTVRPTAPVLAQPPALAKPPAAANASPRATPPAKPPSAPTKMSSPL
jgi:serine/threonine-protein kinase